MSKDFKNEYSNRITSKFLAGQIVVRLAPALKSNSSLIDTMAETIDEVLNNCDPSEPSSSSDNYLDYSIMDQAPINNYGEIESHDLP